MEDRRLSDMGKVANKIIYDYFTKEFEFPIKASERPIDRTSQVRLVGLYLQDVFKVTGLPVTEQPAWTVREQKRILALPENELRGILTKAYEAEIVRHQKMTGLKGNPEKTQAFLKNIAARQTGFKLSLQHIYGQAGEINEKMAKLQVDFHQAYKDTSNFRFYSAHSRGSGLGVMEEGTPEQRQWLRKALTDSDTGDALKASLQEIDRRRAPNRGMMRDWSANVVEQMIKWGFLGSPADRLNKEENNQAIRNSQDFMRHLYLARLDQLKAEREKIKKEMEENRLRRDAARIQLETLKLIELEAQAAAKGRKPMFLEQYEGAKRAGVELPVTCRSMADQLAERQANVGDDSFEGINRRIMETLRAFQGDRSRAAVLEVDRYFRVVLDATTAPPNKRAVAPDGDFLRRLQEPATREFLITPGTRIPGSSQEKLEATAARQMADREFEL